MLIRFLADTYIRPSPYETGEANLGYVQSGSVIEVEDEVLEGAAIDEINHWYKDARGWYYWGGAVEEVPAEETVEIKEDFVLEPADSRPENAISADPGPSEFDQQEGTIETAFQAIASEPESTDDVPAPEAGALVDHPQIPDDLKEMWEGINEDDDEVVEEQEPEDSTETQEEPAEDTPDEQPPTNQPENTELNWSIRQLNIQELFWAKQITGQGVKVALLDTGIDETHPMFAGITIEKRRNFLEAETGEEPDSDNVEDLDGQGTRNAGLIVANGETTEEQVGLAPDVKLYVGKIRNYADEPVAFNPLLSALEWAMEMKVNILFVGAALSKGELENNTQHEDLIELGESIIENGILMIAPVGDAQGPERAVPRGNYPASLETSLSVGAYCENGMNYPRMACSFSLDVLAPGEDLRTTDLDGEMVDNYSGTAAAAAFMTGIAALLLNYLRLNSMPCCDPAGMMRLLRASSDAAVKVRNYKDGFGKISPTEFIRLCEEMETSCLSCT